MNLKDILSEKRSSVVGAWYEVVLDTYPAETSKFLRSQKNQFANPVGATIMTGLTNVLDYLVEGGSEETALKYLDDIVRIRAVQDYSPADALSFIFALKDIVRRLFSDHLTEKELHEELRELEAKIDILVLKSFTIYMECREKIYEIKADEVKRMTFRLLQQANLLVEKKEQ